MKTTKKVMTTLSRVLLATVVTTGLTCNYNIKNISAKEVPSNVKDSLTSGNGQTIKSSTENNPVVANKENKLILASTENAPSYRK